MNDPEELARLGTLDHAVVVGRGHRDGLANAQLGEGAGVRSLVLGWVTDCADADDQTLTLHQPGDAHRRPDGSGVGEGDRGPREVVGFELVGSNLTDQVFVGGEEPGEIQLVCVLDVGNDEDTTVSPFHIHRETEVHVLAPDHMRSTIDLGISRLHTRTRFDPFEDRPADDVREGNLPPAGARQIAVDDPAVLFQQLRRHPSDRRGGGDSERSLHVLGDLGGDTPQRFGVVRNAGVDAPLGVGRGKGFRCFGGRLGGASRVASRGRVTIARGLGRGPVVLEEFLPRLPHRLRVVLVLPVHLVHKPDVRPEELLFGLLIHLIHLRHPPTSRSLNGRSLWVLG